MKTAWTARRYLISVVGLCAAVSVPYSAQIDDTPWYPIYLVRARTYALSVMAPSQTAAVEYGRQWEDRPDNDVLHRFVVDPWAVANNETAKPVVLERDRGLVAEVWHATSVLPTALAGKVTVPTLEEWQAVPTLDPNDAYDDDAFCAFEFQLPNTVNYDHPSYLPSWRPYTVFVVRYNAYVWYAKATTKTSATLLVKAMWITNGIYARKKPLTSDESAAWTHALNSGTRPIPSEVVIDNKVYTVPQLPALPWVKLKKMSIIHRDVYPTSTIGADGLTREQGMLEEDTIEKIGTSAYNVYAPYDWRDLTKLPVRDWWR